MSNEYDYAGFDFYGAINFDGKSFLPDLWTNTRAFPSSLSFEYHEDASECILHYDGFDNRIYATIRLKKGRMWQYETRKGFNLFDRDGRLYYEDIDSGWMIPVESGLTMDVFIYSETIDTRKK